MERKNIKLNKKQDKKAVETAVSKRQAQFDENRDVTEKKPFDKKAYRLKKYSKKYKLEQWEESRKKKLLRDYYKEIKNEPKENLTGSYKAKSFDEDTTDSNNIVGRFVRHPDLIENDEVQSKNTLDLPQKKDPFHKAKEHYNRVKEEKLLKKQNLEKAKEEKLQKLQEYKKKKQQRFKKLSKKNKKGQPMMTGRLEMLLEKIQKNGK